MFLAGFLSAVCALVVPMRHRRLPDLLPTLMTQRMHKTSIVLTFCRLQRMPALADGLRPPGYHAGTK